MIRRLALALGAVAIAGLASAGPPFFTDDPDPVKYRHWEAYAASQILRDADGWSGTAPHVEVNYGAIPDLQLHVIAPLSFSAPSAEKSQFGYGDTELGVKYRFIEETPWRPMVGVFPLVELPTGDSDRDLGSGQTMAFLPLWLQKTMGAWTTYGGGGYWINPGAGNFDWWFFGWLLQYQVLSNLAIGAEIVHATVKEQDGESNTLVHAGGIFDFSDTKHVMFSAGPAIQGPSGFQCYVAFQLTWGPDNPPFRLCHKQFRP